MVGYSITYFFRGRHIQSDVGDNENMKKIGLKCTSQQIREDEAELRGEAVSELFSGCSGDCQNHDSCDSHNLQNVKKTSHES